MAQFKGGTQPPVRVPQGSPGNEDPVSLACGDGVFGLARGGQQAHCSGRNTRLAPDPGREFGLISGTRPDLLVGHGSPAGHVHQVDTVSSRLRGETDGGLDVDPASHPVGRRYP